MRVRLGRRDRQAQLAAEAALGGGTAGAQYDLCHHLACATFTNVNEYALDVNADPIATLSFGMSTTIINGKKGKRNFKQPDIGPPGT